MKIGYGTHSGIHNVLFEGNRVDFAGIAIKISSHLGCVSGQHWRWAFFSSLGPDFVALFRCLVLHPARVVHSGTYPSTTLWSDRQVLR